jgi:hypothetical protein
MTNAAIGAESPHRAFYQFMKWLFGILFFFMALLFLPRFPVAFVWLLACSLVLLPPTARMIMRKMNYIFPKWLNVTAATLGTFAMLGILGHEAEKAMPSVENNPAPAQQTPPLAPVSEEEQLRQITSDVLKGDTNMGKPRLRKVEVVKQAAGGWGVFAEFNGDDNLTARMRKGGIETKMAEVYVALYTSGKDVQTASVAAYFPLVDKYGNESDGIVYKTTLNRKEADKVNWGADNTTLRRSILPGIWTATLVHPEFR